MAQKMLLALLGLLAIEVTEGNSCQPTPSQQDVLVTLTVQGLNLEAMSASSCKPFLLQSDVTQLAAQALNTPMSNIVDLCGAAGNVTIGTAQYLPGKGYQMVILDPALCPLEMATCPFGYSQNPSPDADPSYTSYLELCCDKLCPSVTCPDDMVLKSDMWALKVHHHADNDTLMDICCLEKCSHYDCPANYQPKPNHMYLIGNDKLTCCDQLCSGYSCPALMQPKLGSQNMVGSDATTCCDLLCSGYSCASGLVPLPGAVDQIASQSNCCQAAGGATGQTVCTGYTCPPAAVPELFPDATKAQNDENCCNKLCTNATCPTGFVLKPNAAFLVTPDDAADIQNTCCDQTCTAFQCPGGYQQRGSLVVGNDRNTCCDPLCSSFTCPKYMTNKAYPGSGLEISLFGNTAPICCSYTCAGLACPSGSTPINGSDDTLITAISDCCTYSGGSGGGGSASFSGSGTSSGQTSYIQFMLSEVDGVTLYNRLGTSANAATLISSLEVIMQRDASCNSASAFTQSSKAVSIGWSALSPELPASVIASAQAAAATAASALASAGASYQASASASAGASYEAQKLQSVTSGGASSQAMAANGTGSSEVQVDHVSSRAIIWILGGESACILLLLLAAYFCWRWQRADKRVTRGIMLDGDREREMWPLMAFMVPVQQAAPARMPAAVVHRTVTQPLVSPHVTTAEPIYVDRLEAGQAVHVLPPTTSMAPHLTSVVHQREALIATPVATPREVWPSTVMAQQHPIGSFNPGGVLRGWPAAVASQHQTTYAGYASQVQATPVSPSGSMHLPTVRFPFGGRRD